MGEGGIPGKRSTGRAGTEERGQRAGRAAPACGRAHCPTEEAGLDADVARGTRVRTQALGSLEPWASLSFSARSVPQHPWGPTKQG